MKKTFPGYYRPTEDEFKSLWDKCLFVLDANVLLNLYRYSQRTSNELIGILSQIGDRLWVSHQAALEYQTSRLNVIAEQFEAYDKIQNLLRDCENRLENNLTILHRHPIIDSERLLKMVKHFVNKIDKEIAAFKETHPDLLKDDNLMVSITTLLDGKVGEAYSHERLKDIYKSGQERYKDEIPPGYKDMDKGNVRKYGDLIIWFQIIEKANELKIPIILVTDDRKDDWWLKFKGQTIGPRPELIQEMRSEANVPFYMYQADQFMEHAQKYLQREIEKEAVEEVRGVRRHDEEDMEAGQEAMVSGEILGTMDEAASAGLTREVLRAMQKPATVRLAEDMLRMEKAAMPTFFGATEGILREAAKMREMHETLSSIPAGIAKQIKEIQEAATMIPGIHFAETIKGLQGVTQIASIHLAESVRAIQEAYKLGVGRLAEDLRGIRTATMVEGLLPSDRKTGEKSEEDLTNEPEKGVNNKEKKADGGSEPSEGGT
jgi:hypothetical protein